MKIQLKNLGTVNKNMVTIKKDDIRTKDLNIYFSYETPISFVLNNPYMSITRVNDWSTTTGKLINECEPDKKKRVSGDEFMQKLSEVLTLF